MEGQNPQQGSWSNTSNTVTLKQTLQKGGAGGVYLLDLEGIKNSKNGRRKVRFSSNNSRATPTTCLLHEILTHTVSGSSKYILIASTIQKSYSGTRWETLLWSGATLELSRFWKWDHLCSLTSFVSCLIFPFLPSEHIQCTPESESWEKSSKFYLNVSGIQGSIRTVSD